MNTGLKILFIGIVCVVTLGLLLKKATQQAVSREQQLVVGMMSGWAPFMSINSQGDYEGFDVDVATKLAQRLGKKLVIQDLGSLASLFVALEQGKIDMIFSGLDITQERLNRLAMVPYTGQEVKEYDLVFWKNIPSGIASIQDLQNYPNPVVCVEPGVSAEKFLDRFPFVIKKQLAALVDRMLDIQYGKSLAVLLEPLVARRLVRKDSNLKVLSVPLPPEFQLFGCGIALAKNNTALTQTVAQIIQGLKRDGTLAKLEAQWRIEGV